MINYIQGFISIFKIVYKLSSMKNTRIFGVKYRHYSTHFSQIFSIQLLCNCTFDKEQVWIPFILFGRVVHKNTDYIRTGLYVLQEWMIWYCSFQTTSPGGGVLPYKGLIRVSFINFCFKQDIFSWTINRKIFTSSNVN